MLPFSVQFRAGEPAYEQVALSARRAISSGRLQPGDRFPSVRAMSRELSLTPVTCQKAVTALVQEGWLEIQPGVGAFVRESPTIERDEAALQLQEPIERLIIEAKHRGLSRTQLKNAIDAAWKTLEPPNSNA
ncbi:MAG: GntR family transcriptional regulator [Verrucomicrobiota bacterium]